jgi:hypothetical protein
MNCSTLKAKRCRNILSKTSSPQDGYGSSQSLLLPRRCTETGHFLRAHSPSCRPSSLAFDRNYSCFFEISCSRIPGENLAPNILLRNSRCIIRVTASASCAAIFSCFRTVAKQQGPQQLHPNTASVQNCEYWGLWVKCFPSCCFGQRGALDIPEVSRLRTLRDILWTNIATPRCKLYRLTALLI